MCDILHIYLLYRIGIFFPPFRRSGASVKNCQVKKIFFTVSENLHPIFLSFPSVTSLCWWLRWTSSTTPCGRSMLRLRGAPASLGKVAERERTRGRRGGSKVRARLKPCLSHAQKRSRGAGTKEPLLKFLPSQLARGEVVSSPPVFSPEASSSINPPPSFSLRFPALSRPCQIGIRRDHCRRRKGKLGGERTVRSLGSPFPRRRIFVCCMQGSSEKMNARPVERPEAAALTSLYWCIFCFTLFVEFPSLPTSLIVPLSETNSLSCTPDLHILLFIGSPIQIKFNLGEEGTGPYMLTPL